MSAEAMTGLTMWGNRSVFLRANRHLLFAGCDFDFPGGTGIDIFAWRSTNPVQRRFST